MNQKRPLAFLILGFLLAGMTTQGYADSLQTVAKRIAKGLDRLTPKRIAVLQFPYPDGKISSGSSIISERLLTLLVEQGGVEVVERALLDKALNEIQMGTSGILDPATTQKLGKILGVSGIVTGTLNDLGSGRTEVNARLIKTETGAILAAAMVQIRRTWSDDPRQAPELDRTKSDEDDSHLHMSKLIPTHSPRRLTASPAVYTGAMQPLPAESVDPSDPVLTLTNEDLIPLKHRGLTDPGAIVDDFLSGSGEPPAYAIRMARRIYQNNPDAKVRGRALMAMGHILERTGRPSMAAHAYQQVLQEFPDHSSLQTDAHRRLEQLTASR